MILNHPFGNSLQFSAPDCFVFQGQILANEGKRNRSLAKIIE